MKKIVLATGNLGKVKELSDRLAPLAFDVVAQSEFTVSSVAETGTTFVENAIIKARHAAAETGLPAIADDSGLEVDYLNGAPGIYSSRYSGDNATDELNNSKLLEALSGVPAAQRTARFQCVLVFMLHKDDPTPIICQGSWEGTITDDASGRNGFGYDPLFWLNTHQCTSADLTKQEKNTISHRGQALNQLLALLPSKISQIK